MNGLDVVGVPAGGWSELGETARTLIGAAGDAGRATAPTAAVARPTGPSAPISAEFVAEVVCWDGFISCGLATSVVNLSKNASAICLLVASTSRAPSWAILPPTCALTS